MNSGRKYYFLTIAETLNMTRAAEKLMVSQPSLTQYLNKLEKELDVKLLDRSFTPLRLTPAGNLYMEYLKRSLELERTFEEDLEDLKAGSRSPLRIGIPMQKTHELIKVVLPKFMTSHPNINLSIWEGTSSTVKERVISGEDEIGFGHTFTTEDELCTIRGLNYEKIVIICSAENPILGGKKTSLRQPYDIEPELLNSQLFFQMAPEYFLYEVEAAHLKKHGVNPRKRLVMSNLYAIINSVAESKNSGFAYIPDYCFNDLRAKDIMPALGFIRLGHSDIDWQFAMMRKKDRPLSHEARLFWDCVLDTCCEI